MGFKENWIAEMTHKVSLAYPDWSEGFIEEFVAKEYDKNFKDNECQIYNNYEKETLDTTISSLIDWLDETKPIVTESGSLFKHHDEAWSPSVQILKDKLDERSAEKKNVFKYTNIANSTDDKEEKEKYMVKAEDAELSQKRLKVIANSEYGVSGLPSSWFFNMACASATTARGQALISTAFNAFEDFLADGVRLYNMDECIMFIDNVLSEEDRWCTPDERWVNDKDIDDVYYRLKGKFKDTDVIDKELLYMILSNMNQTELNRIYYKSNMIEFFNNSKRARKILRNIIMTSCEYMDPVKPPKSIAKDLNKLRCVIQEFVHYNYPYPNRVTRLRTELRQRVVVIDTDSNFINLGPWVNYIYENIISDRVCIRRKDMNDETSKKIKEQEVFRMVNTMVYFIDQMIGSTLEDFLTRSNIPLDNPGTTKMKNEFLYQRILITLAKKHYIGLQKLREGNYYPTPKLDVKGMDFMKLSAAGETTIKFCKDLITHDILDSKTETPDIAGIYNKLFKFIEDITESVMNGDAEYVKTVNLKTADAYADPMKTGSFKAAFVWNSLYPDDQIDLPGRAYIINVKWQREKDFADLSVENPEMFERMTELFKNPRIKKSGIKAVAIPLDRKVPKWMRKYVDVNSIITKNTNLLLPALNAIGMKTVYKVKSSMNVSNIIKL